MAPKILVPAGYLGGEDAEGEERIVPENSNPGINGRGGWCWYLPWVWRLSKKLRATVVIAIRYWVGEGVGSGRVVGGGREDGP